MRKGLSLTGVGISPDTPHNKLLEIPQERVETSQINLEIIPLITEPINLRRIYDYTRTKSVSNKSDSV